MRASCTCTSAVMLRAGRVECATCGAPVVSDAEASTGYSTRALPRDCRNADAFNRACRSGRVEGATKTGRVWSCTAAAWTARAAAPTPRGLPPRLAKTSEVPAVVGVPDALLAELGARRTA